MELISNKRKSTKNTLTRILFFVATVIACEIITTCIFADQSTVFNTQLLIQRFLHEPEDIRLFRARGMLNYYYRLEAQGAPDAKSTLLSIINIFPEFIPAKLEYAMMLEKKGDGKGAYFYLLQYRNQQNAALQSMLNRLAAQAYEIELSGLCLRADQNNRYPNNISVVDQKQISSLIAKTKVIIPTRKTIKKTHTVSHRRDQYSAIMQKYFSLKKMNMKVACDFLTKKEHQQHCLINNVARKRARSKCVLQCAMHTVTRSCIATLRIPIVKRYCDDKYNMLLELGYCLLALQKPTAALPYFIEAQKIYPHHYQIANQIGYIENTLNQNKKACYEFQYATESDNQDTMNKAEVALINLSSDRMKFLPNPWYFELYTEPYYYARFNDFIFPLESRLGVALGNNQQYHLFISYRAVTDTASEFSGTAPQIYNDNVEIFAGGFRYFPFKNIPFFAYSEYGIAHNLQSETLYPNSEQDYRGGLVYSDRWGAKNAYSTHFVAEFKPWYDVYSNVSYYSRYKNMIGQLTGRAAVRIVRWRHMTISPYLKTQLFFDSQQFFYNNIVEYGPGVMVQPYNAINFVICYEHLFGVYIPVHNNQNPYGPNYQTNIVRAQLYLTF